MTIQSSKPMSQDPDDLDVITIRLDPDPNYGSARGTMMVFEFAPGFFEGTRKPRFSPDLIMEVFSTYLPSDNRTKKPEHILHLPWNRAVNAQGGTGGLRKDLCTYSFDSPADAQEIAEEIEAMLGGLQRNNILPDAIRLIGVDASRFSDVKEALEELRLNNIELDITLPKGPEHDRPAPYPH